MADLHETDLPGVGTRYDFACLSGTQVGVIVRHSGRRELVVYDADDPDAVRANLDLSPEEARTLGELLGGSRVVEQLDDVVRRVDGLALDWLVLPRSQAPRTIAETELRSRTGVTVIALVRDGVTVPAPGPDDELRPGDTIVVTGTVEGIAQAVDLLSAAPAS
jgi:TrkA domain protein